MSTTQVGLKAEGLCLEPLLQHGIPSSEVIDAMIKEIDEQLYQNNRQLEDCVRDLLSAANSAVGDRKFATPMEAVTYLADTSHFDKTGCYDPEPDDIARLLRHVRSVMDKNPGCEESMLQNLLKLSSLEGISLPIRSSHSDHVTQSTMSINTVVDEVEQMNETLWYDICVRFRKYFIDKINKLPVGQPAPRINIRAGKRLQYVQSLCALYPADEIWPRYRSLRTHQVQTCLHEQLAKSRTAAPSSPGNNAIPQPDDASFESHVASFESGIQKLIIMIREDFELFNSGVLTKVTSTFDALQEIYLESASDELSGLIEKLHNEMASNPQKGSSGKGGDIPKSNSEFVRLGQPKNILRKQHSKSLDSLLSTQHEEFTDLQPEEGSGAESSPPTCTQPAMPASSIPLVVRLVRSVLEIEKYMDCLHHTMVWEVGGSMARKSASKTNLKGVLKSTEDAKPFSPRAFEKSGLLPDAIPPPFGATEAMMSLSDSHSAFKVIEKDGQENRINWSWRTYFHPLATDIAKGLDARMREITERALLAMKKSLDTTGTLEMMPVSQNLVGGRLDYPKWVAKAVYAVVQEVEELVVLGQAGSEGPFMVVASAFVDSSSLSFKNISVRLAKVSAEVSEKKYGMRCLYAVLSTTAYIRNHLLHLEHILGAEDTSKRRFSGLYRQYCELVDALSRQVVEHHTQLLCTSILHDAESQNWAETKDFYEDERCSFTVQMWNLHLSSLRHDLWEMCPPKLAQSVIGAILQESLSILTQRYARVKPSYKRTKLFRRDVTILLLCTSEHLYWACNSIVKYLDVSLAQQPFFSIHNLCTTLLSTMAIVTAPLDVIYKVYKKGFHKKRNKSNEEIIKGYPSHWLSWIRPTLLPLGQTSYGDLQTTTALHLQLRLLASQPEVTWPLLIQALLMKHCTLSIMLMTQAARQTAPPPEEPTEADAEQLRVYNMSEQLFGAMVDILLQCQNTPAALAQVLVPVMESAVSETDPEQSVWTDTWTMFDNKSILGKTYPLPPWISAIFKAMEPLVLRLVDPAVRLVMKRYEAENMEVEPLTALLEELPCGCPPANTALEEQREAQSKDILGEALYSLVTQLSDDLYVLPTPLCMFFRAAQDKLASKNIRSPHNCVGIKSKDILGEALYSLVTQLSDDLYVLPTPLCMFFRAAQDKLASKNIRSPHNCVGIKVLAGCLRSMLVDIPRIESMVGERLPDDIRDVLVMLAECTYHVLTSSSYGKGSGTPRVAALFMKANRNWLMEQVETITDHFSDDVFEPDDSSPLEEVNTEFVENQLVTVASSILGSYSGEASLKRVYHLVLGNLPWIHSKLDITPLVGEAERPDPTAQLVFKLTTDTPPAEKFNPLYAFDHIGDVKLDHTKMDEFEYDWMRLLQSDLGLTETNFRTLLYHRQEMQEAAYLDDTEKKPIQVLKGKYELDPVDLC